MLKPEHFFQKSSKLLTVCQNNLVTSQDINYANSKWYWWIKYSFPAKQRLTWMNELIRTCIFFSWRKGRLWGQGQCWCWSHRHMAQRQQASWWQVGRQSEDHQQGRPLLSGAQQLLASWLWKLHMQVMIKYKIWNRKMMTIFLVLRIRVIMQKSLLISPKN